MSQEELNALIDSIKEFILEKDEKIFIESMEESVAVYEYLQREFKKVKVNEDYFFQFVFRSFYSFNQARLDSKFEKEYFNVFQSLKCNDQFPDNAALIKTIYNKLQDKVQSEKIQFSFITKMAHTINCSQPIYDSQVAKVLKISPPVEPGRENMNKRLDKYISNLQEISDYYNNIIKENKLDTPIKLFEKKFSSTKVSKNKIKILDFILWQAGKQNFLLWHKQKNEEKSFMAV